MANQDLILEATYNQPINLVWNALTENEALKEWYFILEDFKPELGFKFEFTGGQEDGEQYLHLCEIVEVIREKKIAYTWKYKNYPGNTLLSWELFEDAGKTRLKLTHSGLESFKENGKDFSIDSFNAGWNYFLNEALLIYLNKN